MPLLKIGYKNPEYNEILDAFAARFSWKAESGLTKAQFVEKCLRDYIEQTWNDYEYEQLARVHASTEKARLKTKATNSRVDN